MKKHLSTLLIICSLFALLLVLTIQINWIMETAKIKEELFNEKANMILSRTIESLNTDQPTCVNIDRAIRSDAAHLNRNEKHKIDSLFNYFMRFYNFKIDYEYVFSKPTTPVNTNQWKAAANEYQKCVQDAGGLNGIEIKLIFPDKKKFIVDELSNLFIASILLILIVFLLFLWTVKLLKKEERMSAYARDFLTNMTHEFKTPITNISLASKMIQQEIVNSNQPKVEQYSHIIYDENEKLKIQVEQVLSMSALERDEIPMDTTTIDFHALLKQVSKVFFIQFETKHGELKLLLTAQNFMIQGDKNLLTNALLNLLDNSIKYAHQSPIVTISTQNKGGYLEVMITDNGIGINKQYHQHIFKKFFRVPTGNLHEVKGFGLGLAYVDKIIAMHKATIELESEVGKGSQFIMTIPNA